MRFQPRSDKETRQITMNVTKGKFLDTHFKDSPQINLKAEKLIKGMLEIDPNKR